MKNADICNLCLTSVYFLLSNHTSKHYFAFRLYMMMLSMELPYFQDFSTNYLSFEMSIHIGNFFVCKSKLTACLYLESNNRFVGVELEVFMYMSLY